MPDLPHAHVITPGDHYSPRTGSAVVQVVHGLASHTVPRPVVLVARGTYPDHYDSATVREYAYERRVPGRLGRIADIAGGRVGLPRKHIRLEYKQVLAALPDSPHHVIAHNGPAFIGMVPQPHEPSLYAHNILFRTYGRREAGKVLDRAHRIICVSSFIAGVTADRLPIRLHNRLRVVHNGVDLARFQAVPRVPRQGPLRVLFVGRVIPGKGVHVLVAAARLLDTPEIAVKIVGSSGFDAAAALSPYEQRLRRDAATFRTPVDFLPFQAPAAIVELMRAADVVAVPSIIPEALSLVALEGFAAGASVVASDIGGLPEALGSAGILVPPDNARALAEALKGLITHQAGGTAASEAHAATLGWDIAASRLSNALSDS